MAQIEVRRGVVARFGPKGFGFLSELPDPTNPTARSTQWFFHIADVVGRRELQPGDTVLFQDGGGIAGKAPKAICIALVAPVQAVKIAQPSQAGGGQ